MQQTLGKDEFQVSLDVEAILDTLRHFVCNQYPVTSLEAIHQRPDIFESQFLKVLDDFIAQG